MGELVRLMLVILGGSAALAAIWGVRPQGRRELARAIVLTAVIVGAFVALTPR